MEYDSCAANRGNAEGEEEQSEESEQEKEADNAVNEYERCYTMYVTLVLHQYVNISLPAKSSSFPPSSFVDSFTRKNCYTSAPKTVSQSQPDCP